MGIDSDTFIVITNIYKEVRTKIYGKRSKEATKEDQKT